MGIGLDSFRNAFQNISASDLGKSRMSVQDTDGAKTSVSAVVGGKTLSLSKLKKLPGGADRIMDNIYMRSQLLTGIRDSLMSLNLDSTSGTFENKMAEKFFKEAEKKLFGALVKNKTTKKMEFGEKTAASDLDGKTVNDLLKRLGDLMTSGKAEKEFKLAHPGCTSAQATACLNPNKSAIAKVLGLGKSAAKTIQITKCDVGRDFAVVTVSAHGVLPQQILLDRNGGVHSAKEYADLCGSIREVHKGSVPMAKNFSTKDFEDIKNLVNTLRDSAIIDDGDGASGFIRQCALTMLPNALKAARQIQKKGPISNDTWWKALKLEGEPPAKTAEFGNALMTAIFERITRDYGKARNLNQTEFKIINMRYREDTDEETEKLELRRGYGSDKATALTQSFFQFLEPSGVTYEDKIAGMTSKFRPTKDQFLFPLTLQRGDFVNDGDFKDSAIITNLNNNDRASGSTFNFGGKTIFTAHTGTDKAKLAFDELKNAKFTNNQIGLLALTLNNLMMNIPMSIGGVPNQSHAKIDIIATGSAEKPNMKIVCTMPVVVPAGSNKEGQSLMKVMPEQIVQEIEIDQNGNSTCTDLKFVKLEGVTESTQAPFGELNWELPKAQPLPSANSNGN